MSPTHQGQRTMRRTAMPMNALFPASLLVFGNVFNYFRVLLLDIDARRLVNVTPAVKLRNR